MTIMKTIKFVLAALLLLPALLIGQSRGLGPKVAAILSVMESCRRLRVPMKKYLADVLPGLDRRKLSEVSMLTPPRWSAARS